MTTRTLDQKYDLFVTAIKANEYCKGERQNFSVVRSSPIGKHIEPEAAKEAGISLVDCFHRLQSNPVQSERRKAPIQCLKKGRQCEQQIKTYIETK